jgi:hypothetical protein
LYIKIGEFPSLGDDILLQLTTILSVEVDESLVGASIASGSVIMSAPLLLADERDPHPF